MASYLDLHRGSSCPRVDAENWNDYTGSVASSATYESAGPTHLRSRCQGQGILFERRCESRYGFQAMCDSDGGTRLKGRDGEDLWANSNLGSGCVRGSGECRRTPPQFQLRQSRTDVLLPLHCPHLLSVCLGMCISPSVDGDCCGWFKMLKRNASFVTTILTRERDAHLLWP